MAKLLIPPQRSTFVHGLDKTGLTKDGYERSTRSEALSFASGTTHLIGSTVKVHGSISARTTETSGRHVLRIHSDFLFVYPVQRAGQPATWMRILACNYSIVDFSTLGRSGRRTRTMGHQWPGTGVAGARCDGSDGFVHPEFPSGPQKSITPTGATGTSTIRPPRPTAAQGATGPREPDPRG